MGKCILRCRCLQATVNGKLHCKFAEYLSVIESLANLMEIGCPFNHDDSDYILLKNNE